MTRRINKIIIHCSDSRWGDAAVIDDWHKQRGWSGIGYHWVIGGGFKANSTDYDPGFDGRVEAGRSEKRTGAHCRMQNRSSIGICLIGVDEFTEKQFESLKRVVKGAMETHNIPANMVFGHRDFDTNKTCPNFDVMEWVDTWRDSWRDT